MTLLLGGRLRGVSCRLRGYAVDASATSLANSELKYLNGGLYSQDTQKPGSLPHELPSWPCAPEANRAAFPQNVVKYAAGRAVDAALVAEYLTKVHLR